MFDVVTVLVIVFVEGEEKILTATMSGDAVG